MSDVAHWLHELGLSRYAEAFAASDVDLEVLPNLTDDDLRELGVSLGHRKKLLRAIASLGANAQAGDGETRPPVTDAERRHLTVMFCDLAGSTALSTRLDPETLGEFISGYQRTVTSAVERFGGYVARYMGDGVLAYFGFPVAHEDDAERAVHAGLAVIEAVSALTFEVPLATRVGIASGTVVVGELIGRGVAGEHAVVGETPNLAARLQALAEPGTLVVSASTRKLAGARFTGEDLGEHALKGLAAPVRAWRITGTRRASTRFHLAHAERQAPLVGREHELALLRERWLQARDGEGQAVLLSGEAGIGKSCLAEALAEAVVADGHVCLRLQCSPHHASSALHPVIELLHGALGLQPADAPAVGAECVRAFLQQARGEATREHCELLATLLSLPVAGEPPSLRLPPESQRNRTLELLVEVLLARSHQAARLLVFEDAHWADPTSLEMLARLVGALADARVLLLITHRPEFAPGLDACPHLGTLVLNRLGRRLVTQLIDRVAGGRLLPEALREQILARTDGVPLFVEECTRSILESDLLVMGEDAYTLAASPQPLAIPDTLHDSLMARLDRSVGMRETAQRAAAIGREFSHRLLAAVSPIPDAELELALAQLVDAGLVYRRGGTPATYVFKHALIQQAAYESMLRRVRQQVHGRIAEALRGDPESQSQPELLAHHLSEAGMHADAAHQWRRAGEHAASRGSHPEAVAHFERGLSVLAEVGESPARTELELALRLRLVDSLRVTDQHRPALLHLDAAEQAAAAAGLHERLAEVHYQRGNLLFPLGDAAGCLAQHEQALALARRWRSVEMEARALGGVGDALYLRGHMRSAGRSFRACVDLCRKHQLRYTEAANLHMVGWSRLFLLEFAQALDDARRSIELGEATGNHRGELMGWMLSTFSHTERGEFEQAERAALRALALAQRLGAMVFEAQTAMLHGRLQCLRGNRAGLRQRLLPVVERLRRSARRYFATTALGTLALASDEEEERHNALAEAESVLEGGCVGHNRFWFYRDAIDATLAAGDYDEADRYADALEAFSHAEPLPWASFHAERARVLAALGRGSQDATLQARLEALRQQALAAGALATLPTLDATPPAPGTP